MTIYKTKLSIILISLILLSVTSVYGQFAGGSGTESDPWQVATAEQLNQVRNYPSSHFIQTADIDLGVAPWNQGSGWVPIGNATQPFTGFYDGDNHSIDGLCIDQPTTDNIGLFGYTNRALISNLHLTDATVSGRNKTGSLVGFCDAASVVDSCSVLATVIGYQWNTGGLAGRIGNNVIVSACSSSGYVNSYEDLGGLIGYSYQNSKIVACYSSASVLGSGGTCTGGLVGNNENSTVSASYSSGSVYSYSNHVGGLIGLNSVGAILNSYSLGPVSGQIYTGGLVGYNDRGSISDCYSVGSVNGSSSVGGLIGSNASATVLNCYWNTQTSGRATSAGGKGRTTAEMTWPYVEYCYEGWNWNDWIPDTGHNINEGYPYLYYYIDDYQNTPSCAINPSPGESTQSMDGNVVLSWQGQVNENYSNLFTGFKFWLGTDNPPTNLINGLDLGRDLSYDPNPDLAINTTYYWRVVPYNPVGEALDCPIWSFTTYNPAPVLLYPNGSELWMANTTQQILWAPNAPPSVKLDISFDNGENWNSIGTTEGSSGLYHYQVPAQSSSNCLIKLSNAENESFDDISEAGFSITTSTTLPKLMLSYPSVTGLHLGVGLTANLSWTRQNVSQVALDFSPDNGVSWMEIAENVNSNSFSWIIPDYPCVAARLRVRSMQNPDVYDISDSSFRVNKINIIYPNGGELLTGDHSGSRKYLIRWSSPFVDNVKIEYSYNGGSSWSSVTNSTPANPEYLLWTIPSLPTTNALLRISNTANTSIKDICDADLIIQNPIRIMNANGGGFITDTSIFTLRWHNQDMEPDKLLYWEYSTDGYNWYRINSTPVPVTDNYMDWYADTGLQSTMWLRAIEHGSNYIVAKSASSFRVTDKQLQISSPTPGEVLGVDSYHMITWHSVGCTNLAIDYSYDFGQTWEPIAASIPSNQSSYLWQVPNTPSNQCRLRLRDTTHSYMWVESEAEFIIYPFNFTASFNAAPTVGYADLEVQFTDQSVGIVSSWQWDFNNDGVIDSNLQNPLWIFQSPGFYTVSLTISAGGISNTVTRQNYIYVYPMQADFSASQTSGYLPLTIQFADLTQTDLTQWHWDFNNDGQIDSDSENPIWTYLFPGTYTVSQTVSNGLDSDTEIKENYITVSLNPAITRYVPTQYLTIQAAIDASSNGDYIIIANGTYFENLLLEGKDITLASYYFIDGDSSHIANTIIDGSNAINPDQASTITILPGTGRPVISPHVVGFTIRGGSGRRIVQNQGESTIEKRVGGGIYTRSANPIFSFNRIEDNDADDEGGGSYAFQSLPNHGGMVDPAIGIYNPGGNYFANNQADIGADIYIEGITLRDPIKFQNCSFAVISEADTTVSNYWVTTSSALSFDGSTGREPAISTDVYVATNGSDTLNNGLSPQTPFKTIDHALSRIYASEAIPLTIHIASGTYSPSLTSEKFPLQMVKNVSLQGAGKDETFLDAEGSADFPRRVINLDNVTDVNISDLTLMNGFVTMVKNYNGGGIGVINSNCNLSNLRLAGSSAAGNGAGIYAYQSSVLADSISLEYNTALGSGGGICVNSSNLEITQAQISHNSANKNGAGIFADGGQIHISHNDISQNQAIGYLSKGGGISISNTDQALIYANRIFFNNADNGAGIYLQSNQALKLDRNRIANNLADYSGGGLFVNTSTGLFTNNLIINNTATQRGGAVYCYSSPQLYSNTIAYNKAGIEGGGMYLNGASPDIQNSIIWANVRSNPEVPNQIYLFGDTSDPNLSYCDLQGGREALMHSTGAVYNGSFLQNMDQFPLFLDPPEGSGSYFVAGEAGFSLQTSSPCADQGNPTTDITDYPLDIIGYSRIANNRIDLGSYETFAYNGAVISASASMLDFGRVRVGASPASTNLTLFNYGSQDLEITSINLEGPGTDFGFEVSGRSYMIPIGGSIELQISFTPSTGGVRSNSLLIHNNSQNSPLFQIELTGTGIDDGTSLPSNVLLEVLGNDVRLTWNQVISDQWGNPFEPSGYLVFGSDRADTPIDDFLLITYTEQPIFIHRQIARLKDRMFYAVVALDAEARSRFAGLNQCSRNASTISWQEIRALLQLPTGGLQRAE